MLELEGLPELVDPVVVTAFEGWNDAGDAASAAVDHLARALSATPLVAIDPEDYYDYQVNRPTVALDADGARRLSWPTTQVSVVRRPAGTGTGDLVLVRGIEPNMRWRQFCDELTGLFDALDARLVVHLGALLADVPHTRPVPVDGSASDGELSASLGLEESHYEGPTGIVGALVDAGTRSGVPSVSLWAAVPHYVAQTPCPKATLALLRRLEDLMDFPVPLEDLPEQARAWERGVEELAREDSEVAEYVRSLETAKDTADLPEASGDAIAREFERYLRRRQRRRDQ